MVRSQTIQSFKNKQENFKLDIIFILFDKIFKLDTPLAANADQLE